MRNRLAFISEHASPIASLGGVDSGGQNVYVSEVARKIARLGYDVDIFTRWDDASMPQTIRWWPGVRVIHIAAGPKVRIEKEQLLGHMDEFTENMKSFMAEQQVAYQLVHANFWMSGLVAANLKQSLGIPFVITFHALGQVRKLHQNGQDKFPAERVDIERMVIGHADKIIAECPQDRIDLIRYYDTDDRKIVVIPCGFNPNEFYPIDQLLARKVLGLDAAEPIILQLGRIVPRKGIDNVIRAVAILKRQGVVAKLLVVGGEHDDPALDVEDPEIVRLKKLAIDEGIPDRIQFTGRKSREMLRFYYSASDVFITTPWYEPFGITPVEAMACGTPVIGARVGGIKHTVEDGHTGFLVPPKRPDLLAKKIERVLSDEQLRNDMRMNCQDRAHRLFKWSSIAAQLRREYDSIIYRHGSRENSQSRKIERVTDSLLEASKTFSKSAISLSIPIVAASDKIVTALNAGNKLLVCGNGGSAAESHHFVAELLGRFEIPSRRALPALALSADTSFITAWSNDHSYADIFARQVQAYGKRGDVLVCFSTTGNSPNLINAIKAATEKEMVTIAITGKDGGVVSNIVSLNVVVPSDNAQRIQELHLNIIHAICGLIESQMFDALTTDTSLSPCDQNDDQCSIMQAPSMIVSK